MGIVYVRQREPFVFEAIGPVRLTPLSYWILRGVGHHFVVKRLKVLSHMEKVGRGFLGRRYDWAFSWSDARLYCSELVWKVSLRGAGIRLCPTRRMKDFDLTAPERDRGVARGHLRVEEAGDRVRLVKHGAPAPGVRPRP